MDEEIDEAKSGSSTEERGAGREAGEGAGKGGGKASGIGSGKDHTCVACVTRGIVGVRSEVCEAWVQGSQFGGSAFSPNLADSAVHWTSYRKAITCPRAPHAPCSQDK